jgi:hypothetical protein
MEDLREAEAALKWATSCRVEFGGKFAKAQVNEDERFKDVRKAELAIKAATRG